MRTRARTWIVSGLLTALAVGASASPALAQGALVPVTGTGTTGCLAMGFAADTAAVVAPITGANALVGTVNMAVPCGGPALTTFTGEISDNGIGSPLSVFVVGTCVAPAVPGGCTVSNIPINPTLDGYILTSATLVAGADSRTAVGVFPSLQKGNYQFRVFVSTSGVIATIEKRLFKVEVFGAVPATAPGSSQ